MPCFLKCLENCIFRLPAIRFLFNFYEFPLINFSESRAGCRVEIDSSQNCIETKIFAGPLRSAFWVLKLPPYEVEPFVSCTRYCQTPVDFSVFFCHLDVDIRILKSRDSARQSDGSFVLLLRIECSLKLQTENMPNLCSSTILVQSSLKCFASSSIKSFTMNSSVNTGTNVKFLQVAESLSVSANPYWMNSCIFAEEVFFVNLVPFLQLFYKSIFLIILNTLLRKRMYAIQRTVCSNFINFNQS